MTAEDVVVHRHGKRVSFTGKFAESVFSKNVRHFQLPPGRQDTTISELVDPYNDYTLNQHGHRGPEFRSGIDFLAAGCSQTYGIGVPENGTWAALLAEGSDMSYANISLPGGSIEWVVDSVLSYFREFGNSKYLFILFPDLFRVEIAVNPGISKSRDHDVNDFFSYGADDDVYSGLIELDSLDPNYSNAPRTSRRPHFAEETLAAEEAIRRSVKAIRYLEQYCLASGIKFVWGSWSDDLIDLATHIPEQYAFGNFIDLMGMHEWDSTQVEGEFDKPVDMKLDHSDDKGCDQTKLDSGKCRCYVDCHKEYSNSFQDAFHFGTDRHVNKGQGHIGVHKHLHIAEDFLAAIKETV